jgi:uncharacterized membrane protein
MEAWSIVIHLLLFFAAWGYAAFLNRKRVYEWYHPDRTYLAVIGGVFLVGIALTAEAWILALPWWIVLLYFTLMTAAGIPIYLWQREQARERRKAIEAIDRRP